MPERARLLAQIENAAAIIAPYWPLAQFIAVNPLHGLEELPFEEAARRAGQLFGGRGYPSPSRVAAALRDGRIDPGILEQTALRHGRPELTKTRPEELEAKAAEDLPADLPPAVARMRRHLLHWLTAFLDEGQAGWAMPYRDQGFYRAWRKLARHDPDLPDPASVDRLPEKPLDALFQLIEPVPDKEREAHLERHLAAIAGWSSYIKWRSGAQDFAWTKAAPISLTDVLAVSLALWQAVGKPALPKPTGPAWPDAAIWLEAWEESYRTGLLEQLRRTAKGDDQSGPAAEAQLVFCIDVRSEVFRRHLERTGPYETIGFAGFFGVPVRHRPLGAEQGYASCPVLLTPAHEIADAPVPGCEHLAQRHIEGLDRMSRLKRLLRALKESVAGTFAFVEASGLVFGLGMAGRTLAPAGASAQVRRLYQRVVPDVPVTPVVDMTEGEEDNPLGLSPSEQAFFAEGALSIMGLTKGFAPLVVFLGHGGQTVNNPFEAGLDCGACGGHRGGPNARALAAILNKAGIREQLAQRGIEIPASTRFAAGEHNTTTDVVTVYPSPALADAQPDRLARLRRDLHSARKAAVKERLARIEGAEPGVAGAEIRAQDWAEVRPEWALAKNAAFIVGHRRWTRDLDLAGRTFLHSYDWQADTEGKALEVILTAPMVVAQWINNQYYFSTVDPAVYGAGSKITHTVVGAMGVMQGNGSDLMTGLPLQSVLSSDTAAYHEPLRLLTVVAAPRARVEAIIARNDILKTLFGNGWVALLIYDPEQDRFVRRDRDGQWEPAGFHDVTIGNGGTAHKVPA